MGGVAASVFGRRNWSDRHFALDLDTGSWAYFSDAGLTKRCGVVQLVAGRSRVVVPEEVRLRGRHAPRDSDETLNYFEVHDTRDESGHERAAPFVVRAPTPREFEEWLRSLQWCLKKLETKARAPSNDRDVATAAARAEMERAFAAVGVSESKQSESSAGRPSSQKAASPRRSGDSASNSFGFTQASFLEMEHARCADRSLMHRGDAAAATRLVRGDSSGARLRYYYQDMAGDQQGPVTFDGLREVWAEGKIDGLSYVYTNRCDEWIDLQRLPTLVRLLKPEPPKSKFKPPPPPPRQPAAAAPSPNLARKGPPPRAFRL